jgi:hypothetical protein
MPHTDPTNMSQQEENKKHMSRMIIEGREAARIEAGIRA